MIANVRATARLAKMEARPKVATKDRQIFRGWEPMVSPERSRSIRLGCKTIWDCWGVGGRMERSHWIPSVAWNPGFMWLYQMLVYQYYRTTVSRQYHCSIRYFSCVISGCWRGERRANTLCGNTVSSVSLSRWISGMVAACIIFFAFERYVLRIFSRAFAAFCLWNRWFGFQPRRQEALDSAVEETQWRWGWTSHCLAKMAQRRGNAPLLVLMLWNGPMTFEPVWLWKLEGEVGSTVTATVECPEPQIGEPMESGCLRLLVDNEVINLLKNMVGAGLLNVPDSSFSQELEQGKVVWHGLTEKNDGFCFVIEQDPAKYRSRQNLFHECDQPLAKVCVAFQYASVVGGLLIMLFSAFVCTGGQSQAMLIAV